MQFVKKNFEKLSSERDKTSASCLPERGADRVGSAVLDLSVNEWAAAML